ncbi:alpha/beta hydrolase family protein [Williamsia deligens]|uniref:Alpha/beta hydrolase family protein n=1 Tax=Williamsia deligens TaxID=321325 RepID=A0ABW3G9V7_9NOCA|nr:lipase family protein [Williamsia deligens]
MTTLVVPAASADEPPPTAAPAWSGLDVRDYAGPIPTTPGTVIRSVPLDRSLWVRSAGDARRFLYSSVDQHGRMAVSTAAVFLPRSAPPAGGWPVVAWAHGTVGIGDSCTPSAQKRSPRDDDYISHWLDQGYAVVGTDYTGLGTPGLMSYLNGEVEARSVVDSVVALRQLGLRTASRWAIVGQSQGAGAAMNAARRATEFSRGRGLDYRGVVATGTPANIESIIALGGPSFPPVRLPVGLTTYLTYILAAVRDARPDVGIDRILTPTGRAMADLSETVCYPELAQRLTGVDVRSYFSHPISSLPNAYRELNRFLGIPASGYDRPIFLGQGLRDIDVPAPFALSLAAQLSAARQSFELHVYPTDHSGTVYASQRDSTPFLARIMAPR